MFPAQLIAALNLVVRNIEYYVSCELLLIKCLQMCARMKFVIPKKIATIASQTVKENVVSCSLLITAKYEII